MSKAQWKVGGRYPDRNESHEIKQAVEQEFLTSPIDPRCMAFSQTAGPNPGEILYHWHLDHVADCGCGASHD